MAGYNADKIETQMRVEAQAIMHHIGTLQRVLPELKKFDGKVINKRFYTHLKDETGQNLGSNNKSITNRYDSTLKNDRGNHHYAEQYRAYEFYLTLKDGNRLDANHTDLRLKDTIMKLKQEYKRYLVDSEHIQDIFQKLVELDNQYSALKDLAQNYIIREAMRNYSHQLR